MTKADIVNEITKTTGIDKPAVLLVIEQFFENKRGSQSILRKMSLW